MNEKYQDAVNNILVNAAMIVSSWKLGLLKIDNKYLEERLTEIELSRTLMDIEIRKIIDSNS